MLLRFPFPLRYIFPSRVSPSVYALFYMSLSVCPPLSTSMFSPPPCTLFHMGVYFCVYFRPCVSPSICLSVYIPFHMSPSMCHLYFVCLPPCMSPSISFPPYVYLHVFSSICPTLYLYPILCVLTNLAKNNTSQSGYSV